MHCCRHRFDADPDPIFHFDSDLDLDLDSDPDPILSSKQVGKSTYSEQCPSTLFFIYFSVQCHRCHNFGQHIEIVGEKA
jgi:hypothetical protein